MCANVICTCVRVILELAIVAEDTLSLHEFLSEFYFRFKSRKKFISMSRV